MLTSTVIYDGHGRVNRAELWCSGLIGLDCCLRDCTVGIFNGFQTARTGGTCWLGIELQLPGEGRRLKRRLKGRGRGREGREQESRKYEGKKTGRGQRARHLLPKEE